MGKTQPRPLRYQGRLNRRGRKALAMQSKQGRRGLIDATPPPRRTPIDIRLPSGRIAFMGDSIDRSSWLPGRAR